MERENGQGFAASRRERLISWSILGIVALIALGVWFQQSRFPVGVWRPVESPAESQPQPLVMPEDAGPGPLAPFATHRVSRLGPLQTFDARSLSDKIDGKADLYLGAGFESLITQRFALPSDPDLWFEVYLYDMGAEERAFAVYSQQKRTGGVPFPAVRHGYHAGNALFFVRNRFYVEVIGAAASDRLIAAMFDSARAFIRSSEAAPDEWQPDRLFPGQGLVSDSVTLLNSNAFGFDQWQRVFMAHYRFGEDEAIGFVKPCDSAAEAKDLARAYRRFLLQYGAVANENPGAEIPGSRWLRLFDGHEVVFVVGRNLAGVHESSSLKTARILAMQLWRKLAAGEP